MTLTLAKHAVWTYWENLPDRKRPAHIELAQRALTANAGSDVPLNRLGPEDLPALDLKLHPGWRTLGEPAHRADYLRVALLERYGGLWLDADVITLRSFAPVLALLDKHDFVAWEYRSGTSGREVTYRVPISAFAVRPGCALMRLWLDRIHTLLDAQPDGLDRSQWHALGREVMNPLLREMVENGTISYYAMHAEALTIPIKAKQRARFFENEPIAPLIVDSPMQTHVNYFNSWMPALSEMDESRILGGNEVICKLFQYALLPERRDALLAEGAPAADAQASTPAKDAKQTPPDGGSGELPLGERLAGTVRDALSNPGQLLSNVRQQVSQLAVPDAFSAASESLKAVQRELRELRAKHDVLAASHKQTQDKLKKVQGALKRAQQDTSLVAAFALDAWDEGLAASALLTDLREDAKSFSAPRDMAAFAGLVHTYRDHMASISSGVYERLDEQDRQIFRQWFLKRFAKVDTLPAGTLADYRAQLKRARALPVERRFKHEGHQYEAKHLAPLGYDLSFIKTSGYILVNDFLLDQYRHKEVYVRPGDIVIDAGGYTGDTAVVFGYHTNYEAQIHSFEMSTANARHFRANLSLTPALGESVILNRLALTDRSGDTVYFDDGDRGDAAYSAFRIGTKATGEGVPTISIDDYVRERDLPRLDFIKMDIEGAERGALAGARETIARYRPRLAISFYHCWDDPFVLPALIHSMHPDYQLYFNWYNKEMANEAVLYAIDRSELAARGAAGEGRARQPAVG